MSSALDEDTRRALDEGRATAGAMLRSAQKDLQKVFIAFLIGFLGTFYGLQWGVWDFLQAVTKARMSESLSSEVQIIVQTPFDVVLLQAKISLAVGILFALPVFIYFARDALEERDMWPESPVAIWKIVVVGLLSLFLFTLGLAYGYFVFFPVMFQFLAQNALSAGFKPRYSIVKWAEFIFLLTVSFGLAAQMPLAITGLSYAEIVRYETFRDKWRHAVVLIFVFGAVFSPPDPFTQIMWAVPLLFLYGFSLYLAKVVVTARRGSEQANPKVTARAHWNALVGAFAVGAAGVYLFYTRGGVALVNRGLELATSDVRVPTAGATVGFLSATETIALVGIVVGLVLAVLALMYFVFAELDATGGAGAAGDPTAIDIGALDEAGVRAAPVEAFAGLTEPQALSYASEAMDEGDHAKAQAILDRFDEAQGEGVEGGEASGAATVGAGGAGGATVTQTSSAYADPSGVPDTLQVGFGRVDWGRRLKSMWNVFAGIVVVAGGLTYAAMTTAYGRYVARAVREYLLPIAPAGLRSELLALVGQLPPAGTGFSTAETAIAAVAVALVVLVPVLLLFVLSAAWQAGRDPSATDLDALSDAELRDAPRSAYAGRSEGEALGYADALMNAGRNDAAQTVLDRFDETQTTAEPAETMNEAQKSEPGSIEDRATRAGGTLFEELTEGETDEDDIGGYYKDIMFIVDSLTSKAFWVVGWFMLWLGIVFTALYAGYIGDIYAGFLRRVPGNVTPDTAQVITLHPVEALIFEVKFSTLIAGIVTVPLLLFLVWPALRDRKLVRGRRYVIFGWVGLLAAGLIGGFALGYLYVAPYVISYLVGDALNAGMIITYRITDFFWLIFYTTAGVGLLADVPVLMVLLNTAGVSYGTMRSRWREVTVGVLTFAAFFTPAGILTMFLVTIPLMVAYGIGLGILFVLTLGGRRDLARTGTVKV